MEKEESKVGADDGCGLRNTEECSSLDFMGTSGGLCLPPEMGSSPSPEETHSLAGQLNIEKAPT